LVFHLAEPVLRIFGIAWTEDDRPAARWFALGCLGVAAIGIGVVVWIWAT
jgi:hypothetical protein